MGSRIRDNPSRVFECFVEIAAPQANTKEGPWVLQKFPDSYSDEEVLKLVPHFCYPCDINCTVVQVFSFVLTGADGKWTFGYCRHTPKASTCLCLLSSLPWHETFFDLLNRIAEFTHRHEASDLSEFLEAFYAVDVPDPGGELLICYNEGKQEYSFHCSDHTKLPSIPENRNVTEYFNAVDTQNMMILFASMLNERRIVITSNKLSRLTACVQSANALIYPMYWQHIFIPILPMNLIDYLSAPMPFLVGVPALVLKKAPKLDLNDIVILYADENRIETPFDDFQSLPPEIVSSLKRRLKNSTAMLGDRVARAFLHSLVQLIGGYSDALNYETGKITFNRDAFIQTRTPNMQPYLQRMLHLQIFQQFIEGRLEMLNSGEGFKDEFEKEVNAYADKHSAKLRNQYKEWMGNMKKEGGAFLKSMKNKTNPAVKQAYKSVKDRGKKAYKGVRSKIQELQQKELTTDGVPSHSSGNHTSMHPRSAPSSPTLLRTRPVTFHGLKSGNASRSSSSIKLTHSADDSTPLTPRQYNLLDVNENNDETAQEPDTTTRSRCSSPNLSMRRISMDLMGDLQDLIFRRCSTGDSNSSEHSLQQMQYSSPVLSSTPNHNVDENIPIPPPRTKKRTPVCLSTRPSNQIPCLDTQTENPTTCTSTQEPLLIQLDAEDSDDIFDPLLAKPSQDTQKITTQPQLFQRDDNQTLLNTSLYHEPTLQSSGVQLPDQPIVFQQAPNIIYSQCLPSTVIPHSPYKQQTVYNPAGFPQNFPALQQPQSPLHSLNKMPTTCPTNVPSNPFLTTGMPHISVQGTPQIHNVHNPFLNLSNGTYGLSATSAQNFSSSSISTQPVSNPFQIPLAQPKTPIPPFLNQTTQPPVINKQSNPFSNFVSWEGSSQASSKSQWESFD